MSRILTQGQAKDLTTGELDCVTVGYVIAGMKTVFETRKIRLGLLKEKYKRWGDLNEALNWTRTDPRLSQIHNESIRSGRGTPYVMGDTTARYIEETLHLATGWMDTPPSYSEMHPDDRITHVMKLMESMPEWQRDQAMRIIDTLAEPTTAKNGTTD